MDAFGGWPVIHAARRAPEAEGRVASGDPLKKAA